MREGCLVKRDDDGCVASVAKRVNIGDDSPHQLLVAIGVDDKEILVFDDFGIHQGRLDDVGRPDFIALLVKGAGVLDVVGHAHDLDVFVIGLHLLRQKIGLGDVHRGLHPLCHLLINLRFEAIAAVVKLGVGRHGGRRRAVA